MKRIKATHKNSSPRVNSHNKTMSTPKSTNQWDDMYSGHTKGPINTLENSKKMPKSKKSKKAGFTWS
jgi:hypothetical protein